MAGSTRERRRLSAAEKDDVRVKIPRMGKSKAHSTMKVTLNSRVPYSVGGGDWHRGRDRVAAGALREFTFSKKIPVEGIRIRIRADTV